MFNYGKILRQFREAKGMTLKATADGIVSVAFLSKIERDISIPNMDVLIRLLARMRVMQDEFLFAINQQESRDQLEFETALAEATIKDDAGRIKRLMESEDQKYQLTNDIRHRHFFLTAATEYAVVKHMPYNAAYATELKQYLLNIDEWTRYEVVLYNNNIMAFDAETVNLLTKTAIDKAQEFISMGDYRRALIAVIVNTTHRLIDVGEYSKATRLIGIGKNMINDSNLALERTELNFFAALTDYHRGNQVGALADAKQAIRVLRYFEMHDWAKASAELWEEQTKTALDV